MGIEPTTDIVCPPLDLKSRRPTRTCPLPFKRLIDRPFKVKKFVRRVLMGVGERHPTLDPRAECLDGSNMGPEKVEAGSFPAAP
jgi:hypothetical protein